MRALLTEELDGRRRSSIAASMLQRGGFNQVSEIAGGIGAWETANLPIET